MSPSGQVVPVGVFVPVQVVFEFTVTARNQLQAVLLRSVIRREPLR